MFWTIIGSLAAWDAIKGMVRCSHSSVRCSHSSAIEYWWYPPLPGEAHLVPKPGCECGAECPHFEAWGRAWRKWIELPEERKAISGRIPDGWDGEGNPQSWKPISGTANASQQIPSAPAGGKE